MLASHSASIVLFAFTSARVIDRAIRKDCTIPSRYRGLVEMVQHIRLVPAKTAVSTFASLIVKTNCYMANHAVSRVSALNLVVTILLGRIAGEMMGGNYLGVRASSKVRVVAVSA